MKKKGILILVCLSLCFYSSFAMAADTGGGAKGNFYIGLVGGAVLPMDASSTQTRANGVSDQADISLKTGWLAGLKAGYLTPFTKRWLGIEIEYNHIENKFDDTKKYSWQGYTYDSNMKLDMFMLNFVGRYPEGRFHPYLGFGVGYADLKLDEINSKYNYNAGAGVQITGSTIYSSGSKGVFAYQGIAGCDFDITENFFLGLGYKYIETDKAKYDATYTDAGTSAGTPYSTSSSGTIETKHKSHNIILTFGYHF